MHLQTFFFKLVLNFVSLFKFLLNFCHLQLSIINKIMNVEMAAKNQFKPAFPSNDFDQWLNQGINEENRIDSATTKRRIVAVNLIGLLADSPSKIASKQWQILEEVTKQKAGNAAQARAQQQQEAQVCTQQHNLLQFKRRLRSNDQQFEAHAANNLLNKQPSQDTQLLKKYEWRSESKVFSKIKDQKIETICQNEEELNEQKSTKEKLIEEYSNLTLQLNEAKQALKRKQAFWASRQKALNQQLQKKGRLAKDYSEQIKQLEAENKLLKKQQAINLKKASEQRSKYLEQKQSNSETIKILEDSNNFVEKDTPDLQSRNHAVSYAYIKKEKSTKDLEQGSEKNIMQVLRLLNKLRRQLNGSQRRSLRLKIGTILS